MPSKTRSQRHTNSHKNKKKLLACFLHAAEPNFHWNQKPLSIFVVWDSFCSYVGIISFWACLSDSSAYKTKAALETVMIFRFQRTSRSDSTNTEVTRVGPTVRSRMSNSTMNNSNANSVNNGNGSLSASNGKVELKQVGIYFEISRQIVPPLFLLVILAQISHTKKHVIFATGSRMTCV